MPEASAITALLGPTNTGKTHRAVERMLGHDSGMIGLPLRLLAREVYDRITTRLGESRVALVTGEEKRVPRSPDYWVCTVEAMPMNREVDFLAVDEIQLAAHDQRGHVFTDRLLSARGRRETWFMGADTMRPLVAELAPTARIEQHPRLSRLASTGAAKLSRTPPRSAVVAFSTPQVYEIAERIRAKRGGAAVVFGALSPRTRNAQVAMFQSGEVDYLVATDAIGMGLNLDVEHVAFTALRKFDGRGERDLEAAELAQIAGRAGRYLRNGSFGTVLPLELPRGIAQAMEEHRFPPLRRLVWRNADLEKGSIEALIASLQRRPPARCLKLVEDAEDTAALLRLADMPEVRARARGEDAVGLLWEIARIPDFRRLLLESHVALLVEIFEQLTGPRAILDEDWIASHIDEIDDPDGDVDTLLGRMASIRTWTYISHQSRWLRGAARWQEETRAIEDRLSDALHERLVQRFVERGAARRAPAPRQRPARAPEAEAKAASPSHPFARLATLRAALAPEAIAPSSDPDRWVEQVIAAPHERFSIDAEARILEGDRPVGRLTRGTTLLLPEVKLMEHERLGAGAASRVLRRLVAFARDLAEALLAPLRAPEVRALSAAARGVAYQIEAGLGTAATRDAAGQLADLTTRDREVLAALGVEIGERVIWLPALLRRSAIEQRAALCRAWFGGPPCPPPGVCSVAIARGVDPRAYAAIGYPVFGSRAIRADVAERVHRALAAEPAGEDEDTLARWIGCSVREVSRIAEAFGAAPMA